MSLLLILPWVQENTTYSNINLETWQVTWINTSSCRTSQIVRGVPVGMILKTTSTIFMSVHFSFAKYFCCLLNWVLFSRLPKHWCTLKGITGTFFMIMYFLWTLSTPLVVEPRDLTTGINIFQFDFVLQMCLLLIFFNLLPKMVKQIYINIYVYVYASVWICLFMCLYIHLLMYR